MDHTPSVVHRTSRSWFQEEIEQVLRRCCEQVLAETLAEPTGGRPAELPDLSLWMAVIVVVLRGLCSQRAIWRLLAGGGLWAEPCYEICDQTVYSRLSRHGSGPLPALFVRITQLLLQWQAPALASPEQQSRVLAPFAQEVVAIDESTLDAVCRRVRPLREVPDGDERLLPGKLVGAFDVRRQLWRAMHYVTQVTDNEKEHALDMLACLAPGTLLLFDLGYFSFAWFDALTKGNYPWVTRLREQTTMSVMHTYYDDGANWDQLVWLGIWDTQSAYLVRAVQVTFAGVTHRSLTNVLNPTVLPMGDLVGLYARRWDIERAFLLLKEWFGLRQLWSSKPQVILAQVWAGVILAQVIQSIRVQMAVVADVEVADISVPLLMQVLGQWNTSGEEGWHEMVTQCRRMGIIRPHSQRAWQAPEIPASASRALPPGRTLVRPGRYPEQLREADERDEHSQQLREAIREQQRRKRAQKKQARQQEEEQIRAEVTKVLKAHKQEQQKAKGQRTAAQEQEARARAKASREKQEQQEQQKWDAYWKQKAPPGAQAPPWTFYIPLYEKGVEVAVR